MSERSPVSVSRSYQAKLHEVCSVLGIVYDLRTETVTLEATPDGVTITVTPRGMVHAGIPALLLAMERRFDEKFGALMTQQDDINAAVAQINATMGDITAQVSQLGTDVTNIQAALAALPPEVDTSALNAAVASLAGTQQNLDAAVTSVGNLAPATPPPAG